MRHVLIWLCCSVASCSVDLTVADQAVIVCDEAGECPTDFSCDLARHRCTKMTANKPPTVAIGTISRTTGPVSIPITVFDNEGDEVSLAAAVGTTTGSSLQPITVLFAPFVATPAGVDVELVWDAPAYFGATGLVRDLVIAITPSDNIAEGATVTSEAFDFGNDPPILTSVTIAATGAAVAGEVLVSLVVIDSSLDDVDISQAQLVLDDVSSPITLDAANFPSSSLSNLTATILGAEHTVIWDTGIAAPIVHGNAHLELQVRESDASFGEVSDLVSSNTFAIDNAPSVTLGSLLPLSGERFVNQVHIPFAVNDPNAQDTLALSFEYGIGETPDVWYQATAHLSSDALTGLAPGTTGVFVWDAAADANGGNKGLTSAQVDTTGDENGDTAVVSYQAAVRLRATPVDSAGASGSIVQTMNVAIGNDVPVASLAEVLGRPAGDVPVAFFVSDNAADPASIELMFRVSDPGLHDLWRTALISQGSTTSLASSVGIPGTQHMVSWKSAADLYEATSDALLEQGIGRRWLNNVELRARAMDEPDGVTPMFGPWSAVATIEAVRNQTPPRVEEVTTWRSDLGGGSGPIPVRYRLVDEEGDPADISVQYTIEIGGIWSDCDEYRQPQSEGRFGLSTAPPDVDGGGGIWHTFIWDPPKGLSAPLASTKLRMAAANAPGMQGTPVEVALLHAVGPSGLAPFEAPFAPAQAFDIGENAYSVTAEDLDGDGNLDVALATVSGLTLLYGDGQGGFPASRTYAATGWFYQIEAVDIDGDEAVDLLVTVGDADNVLLYLGETDQGKPTGTFAAPASITVGDSPREVVVAYLDDDSYLDLAVSLNGSNQVAILLGRGSGSFAAPVPYAAGNMPTGIAAADFDEDDALDLVVAHYGQGTDGYAVEVLFGQKTSGLPNGQFSAPTEVPVGGDNPQDVAAGDLNGDGHADFAVADYWSASVEVFFGDGAGGFALAHDLSTAMWTKSVLITDVTADGHNDVVVVTNGNPGLFIFPNHPSGNGNLTERVDVVPTTNPTDVVVGHLNSDGRPDVMMSVSINIGPQPGLNLVLANSGQGIGAGGFSSPFSSATPETPVQALAADVNDDGILDIISRHGSSPTVYTLLGMGDSGVALGGHVAGAMVDVDPVPTVMCMADLNNDGIQDILYTNHGSPPSSATLATLLGQSVDGVGNGQFSDLFALDLGDSDTSSLRAVVGQFTADTFLDVVLLRANGGTWRSLQGNGDGSFTLLHEYTAATTSQALATDVNVDGHLDIVQWSNQSVFVWLGAGDGSFAVQASQDAGAQAQGMATADVNEDGYADILGVDSSPTTPVVTLLLGQGDGTFVLPAATYPYAGRSIYLGLGELTGDGVFDVVLAPGQHGGPVTVFAGGSAGGVGDGTLLTSVSFAAGDVIGMPAVGDFNSDGLADLLLPDAWPSKLRTLFGQYDGFVGVWTHTLADAGDAGYPRVVGATTMPVGTSRMNESYAPATVTQHVARIAYGGTTVDFKAELLTADNTAPRRLLALTRAWQAAGDRRLARVVVDGDAASPRLRMENTLGERVVPDSEQDFDRVGLDLADNSISNQRGIILKLPILAARTNQDVADAVGVRVYRRSVNWLRADSVASDPLYGVAGAERFLPRILDDPAQPPAYRDVLQEIVTWEEMDPDANQDFLTGAENAGPRYVLDTSDPADRYILVLTDKLGIFQAFLEVE